MVPLQPTAPLYPLAFVVFLLLDAVAVAVAVAPGVSRVAVVAVAPGVAVLATEGSLVVSVPQFVAFPPHPVLLGAGAVCS